MIKKWGKSSDFVEFVPVKHRPCSREDFYNPEDDQKNSAYGFYPLSPSTQNVVDAGYNIKCIEDPVSLYGDFNTDSAANLMVTFELCDSDDE